MPKKTSLVSLVADAVQRLNADAGEEAEIRIAKGRYLHIHVASECDMPSWGATEALDESYKNLDLSGLSEFQRANGGAAGLYFCESDKDGRELDDSEGGQYDGYLSNWSVPMPRRLALKCARDLLDAVGIKVS